jgi:hypothetical protein
VWCSKYSCRLYWIYLMVCVCIVFVFWSFLALPVIGQRAVFWAGKLTANELNWTGVITVITVLTNFAIIFYFCIVYSTVLSFHQFNWTQHHYGCAKKNDRFTDFPFPIMLLLLLYDLLSPVVCVFQFVACIWYSFCPCAVLSALTNNKQLNWIQLLHFHYIKNHLHRYIMSALNCQLYRTYSHNHMYIL